MRAALRPAGRVVLAQSGFLPEMFFAWDAPLDDAVRRACHEYYRERYGLAVQDTARIRGLIGLLQRAGLRVGRVHTRDHRAHPAADRSGSRLFRRDHIPRHLGRTPAAIPDRRGVAGPVS